MDNSTFERLSNEELTDEEEIQLFNFDDLGKGFHIIVSIQEMLALKYATLLLRLY